MKELKFKVGDRVKVIGREPGAYSAVIDDVGKIIDINNKKSLPYLVEFEKERLYYHDGNGYGKVKGKDNRCYWCSKRMLELINRKPIVIYQNGNEVIALDKETNKKAVAKCSPSDNFDFNVGAKIAFERLMEPEKPEFYNGKVVCVNNNGNDYTIGKIYEFTDGVIINDVGCRIYGVIEPFKTFKDFQSFSTAEWLEVKE